MKLSQLTKKKVHIIGINGIGMSALAVYLKKNKIDVSGSDIAKNSNTDVLNRNGINVIIGHKEENIKNKNIDIEKKEDSQDEGEERAEEKNKGGTSITSVDREMRGDKLVDWIRQHCAHFISELHSRVQRFKYTFIWMGRNCRRCINSP